MDYQMAAYGLVALLIGLCTIFISGLQGWKAYNDKSLNQSQRSKDLIGQGLVTVFGVALLGLSIGCFWQSLPSNQEKPDTMAILKASQEKAQKAR